MCGVVGFVGQRDCANIIFEGLRRLEYRGYDSAGIATVKDEKIHIVKSEGKLNRLEPLIGNLPKQSTIGMGHTRWATHGAPTTLNAHPHTTEDLALIHNGIIENYRELKDELIKEGVVFKSETDSEVVLHLLVRELQRNFTVKDALLQVVDKLHGAYALGIMYAKEPNTLYLIKQGSPVVLGAGEGENYFASDALALLPLTKMAIFLNDGEMARLTAEAIDLWDFTGKAITRAPTLLNWTAASADKQGYRHYMLKEINEQPAVVANLITRFVDFQKGELITSEMGLDAVDLTRVRSIVYVACGTAYYSALISKYTVEQAFGVPVSVELASEFRYRDPFLDAHTLVIAVSQSGETADTLACIKHAASKGCQTFSICNVRYSSIARSCDATLYMEAGPEVGVASTKAFTAMVLCHHLFSLACASKLKKLSAQSLSKALESLKRLPSAVDRAVNVAGIVEDLSSTYHEAANFLFIGRGTSYVIALEGALKLKEISYIHAEGYAGGELKHGPIALVDRHMPIVAIAPKDRHYEKMISNIEEVKARDGQILGVGDIADDKFRRLCVDYIPCPQIDDEALQAILCVIPLQFFSYYVAVRRGTDVDQPRNLAKSVTVE
jgi:glucosamine--fructose-6-phosphate aminotransferase (isomerizing)